MAKGLSARLQDEADAARPIPVNPNANFGNTSYQVTENDLSGGVMGLAERNGLQPNQFLAANPGITNLSRGQYVTIPQYGGINPATSVLDSLFSKVQQGVTNFFAPKKPQSPLLTGPGGFERDLASQNEIRRGYYSPPPAISGQAGGIPKALQPAANGQGPNTTTGREQAIKFSNQFEEGIQQIEKAFVAYDRSVQLLGLDPATGLPRQESIKLLPPVITVGQLLGAGQNATFLQMNNYTYAGNGQWVAPGQPGNTSNQPTGRINVGNQSFETSQAYNTWLRRQRRPDEAAAVNVEGNASGTPVSVLDINLGAG
jgi:hypothetical protein